MMNRIRGSHHGDPELKADIVYQAHAMSEYLEGNEFERLGLVHLL